MSRVQLRRPLVIVAVVALLALALVGIAAPTALGASQSQYANDWSSPTPTQWFPVPPDPTPLGSTNDTCTSANSTPAGTEAFFTFPAFSIPGTDTITGIEVNPKYRTNDNHFIQLTNGGALIGSQETLPLNFPGMSNCSSTSIVTIPMGTAGLTPADFNAGDIGVWIKHSTTTVGGGPGSVPISLDSIELVVHHGNQAPTADAGGPYMVDEGSSVSLDGSGSSDPDGDPLTYTWDLDNDNVFGDATGVAPTFSAAGLDGPDTQTIQLQVNDGTVDSAADSASVTIKNVAPTLSNLAATAIDEDGSTTLTGTIADPGTLDTFTLDINWGDPLSPGNVESINLAAGTTNFSIDHQYLDDNPTGTSSDSYTIGVTATDDDGGSDSNSTTVTVSNAAPTIDTIGVASPIDEDGTATLSGTYSDPGTLDTHTLDIDWDGDGTFDETVVVLGGSFAVDHQYLDDDPTGTPSDTFSVQARITDDDTGSDADATSLTVNNVDPVITDIASDATFDDKAEEGEIVTVSGAFTDVGTLDTHTATVDWGDGNVTPATVGQGAGGGTFTAGHAYVAGGVYDVTVTVTDDDTGMDTAMTIAVVTGVGINGGVLQIVGTSGDDHVEVFKAGGDIDVFASFVTPHHRRFDPADVDSVEMWLCAGDDHGNVHQRITVDAVIHGDAGDDMLWGGSGDDFIEGGDGDDMIWGRRGADELRGNDGDDRLAGGKGLDILIGGPGDDVERQ